MPYLEDRIEQLLKQLAAEKTLRELCRKQRDAMFDACSPEMVGRYLEGLAWEDRGISAQSWGPVVSTVRSFSAQVWNAGKLSAADVQEVDEAEARLARKELGG